MWGESKEDRSPTWAMHRVGPPRGKTCSAGRWGTREGTRGLKGTNPDKGRGVRGAVGSELQRGKPNPFEKPREERGVSKKAGRSFKVSCPCKEHENTHYISKRMDASQKKHTRTHLPETLKGKHASPGAQQGNLHLRGRKARTERHGDKRGGRVQEGRKFSRA